MDRASVEPPARDIFFGGGECGAGRDDVGIVPCGGDKKGGTDCHTGDIGHWLAMTGFDNKIKRRTSKRPPFCIKVREKSEILDDLHDLGTDALLSLHGGGADMSGRLENVPVAHF